MADCGPTGSALDRVSRAVINDTSTSKQISSLAAHAAVPRGPMPSSAPERIVLPSMNSILYTNHQQVPQSPSVHSVASHVSPEGRHQAHAFRMQQSHPMMMQPMHHNPHMINHQRLMQQQQVLHMQQQQMLHMQRLIEERHQINQQHVDQWHEGLGDEAKGLLREHLEELQDEGHAGIAQGASVEELMEAWIEAQKDLEGYDIDEEAATNMWSGYQQPKYSFVCSEAPPEDVIDKNWMEEGMKLFDAGRLEQAIRAFEMELQHVDPNNAKAWRMLGKCHAENDQDRDAILCLEQAVERDPYDPESFLALGVSYVNELDYQRALESLKGWVRVNPDLVALNEANAIYGEAADNDSERDGQQVAFDEAQRLLLQALEYCSSHETSNVWEALGVVYNVSRDYDAAVDALQKALESRPQDYQLLNKLGATLANGNKSELALPEYAKAIQLRPRYARAWLNMAISFANLQQYDDASRCYLETLELNPAAIHCWSYLRISLSCAERWDLVPLAASQDLEGFKEHFRFGRRRSRSTGKKKFMPDSKNHQRNGSIDLTRTPRSKSEKSRRGSV